MTGPIVLTGEIPANALRGKTAIITGAGTGIGFEAARSLAWLGAQVIIAEISPQGEAAAQSINAELSREAAWYIQTDVGDEESVSALARKAKERHGFVDIVINNATVAPLGLVTHVPADKWDQSYRVNLKGPVMLAQHFLPAMAEREGVFICVTSEGLAYMGAYESLKAAQGHLARTLDAELEGTGVSVFALGPGMVPTETALNGVRELACYHKKSEEEMFALVKDHFLSIEAAGAGYAAAVVYASQFRGQEIGSIQALLVAGIDVGTSQNKETSGLLSSQQLTEALPLCQAVVKTLNEQAQGWRERSIFERQWMFRDFKKNAGMPVEQWQEALARLEEFLANGDSQGIAELNPPIVKLADYYRHMADLAKGYTKDKAKLAEHLQIIQTWIDEAEALARALQ